MKKPRLVVLGGGNGTSRLLRAFKPWLENNEIESLHALVLNADDGGSTGRLRAELGVAAMGDITRCLVALSDFHGDLRGEQLLKAMNHRFEEGALSGHSLRNVFLAGLQLSMEDSEVKKAVAEDGAGSEKSLEADLGASLDAAVAMMARILQVPKNAGAVLTTIQALTQQVFVEVDGNSELLGEGQHFISHNVNLQADHRWQPGSVKVKFKEGEVELNPRAAELLTQATHVIVAPGHTYGTILPTLALPALGSKLAKTDTKLIAVMTLLTTPKQTTGWSGEDFVDVYQSYIGRNFDSVIGNTGEVETNLVEGQDWVRFGKQADHIYHLELADVVSSENQENVGSDVVPRAIVIHDAEKIAEVLAPTLLT